MFKYLSVWFAGLFPFICAGAPIQISIDPNPVVTNETAMFTLSYSQNDPIAQIEFPSLENIVWQTNIQSSGSSLVNGQLTISRSYGMLVQKDGTYTIPALTVQTASGKSLRSHPLTFQAQPRDYGFRRPDGTRAELSELLFMRAEFPQKRPHCFSGEFFPVTVQYYFRSDLKASVTNYPAFAENALFAVNRITDPQTGEVRDFNFRGQTKVIENHQEFNVMIFDGMIRPLKPGSLGSGVINGSINLPDRPQKRDPFGSFFADDFFGSPMRAVKVSTRLPNLPVQAVPPPPAGVIDLGLIGNYALTLALSDSPYREGDPLTLDLTLSGFAAEGAKAEKLNLPGFRTFPPEVSKVQVRNGQEAARLRYVLVPMTDGMLDLNVSFAFFDPIAARYEVKSLVRKLDIQRSAYPFAAPSVQSFLPDANPKGEPSAKVRTVSDILYLKPLAEPRSVRLPLWQNGLSWKIILAGAAFLFLLGAEVWRQMSDSRRDDPAYARKQSASARRRTLLRKLENVSGEEFETLCRTEFSDWLSDTAGLPAGSGLNELASRAKSPELSNALRALEAAGYRPGGLAGELEPCRKIFGAVLRKGAWICTLMFAPFTWGADAGAQAYDSGDFKTALDSYQKLIDAPGSLHADLFFNAGNALYQLRRYPESLLMYERARRLAPGDADILSNLNAVCRKLEVPERAIVTTPLDFGAVLRDTFRADTWMTLCALSLALVLVWTGLWRLRVNIPYRPVLTVSGALVLLSLVFLIWQENTLYRDSEAVVLRPRLPVWNLPLSQSAKQLSTLPAGLSVEIRERRTRWALIRYEGGEGWVESAGIEPVWPPEKK